MSKHFNDDYDFMFKKNTPPHEYHYQARIGMCGARKKGDVDVFAVVGAFAAHEKQEPLPSGDEWENWQCEIIIRPIKKIGTAKMKGCRADSVLTQLGDDNFWI